jgi:hypothetical protein
MIRSVDRSPQALQSQSRVEAAATDSARRNRRRAIRMWTAALVLLCGASLWLQLRNIDGTLPYPLFVDESFVAAPAARMLTTGTLNPQYFNYDETSFEMNALKFPSLPMYLTAIGFCGAHGITRSKTSLSSGVRYKAPDSCLACCRSSPWLPLDWLPTSP